MRRTIPLLTKLYHKNSSHPSVQKIKREFSLDKEFELSYTSNKDINQIIKYLNINKAKRPDGISAKFVKISADIANIINKDISNISEIAKLQLYNQFLKRE